MPTTRRACRAALFQSIGDDVLTHVLATMTSFADRSAIKSVCKRYDRLATWTCVPRGAEEVSQWFHADDRDEWNRPDACIGSNSS